MANDPLTPEQLHALRSLDTCLVANAIETFRNRLRNEGFSDGSVHCRFPQLSPVAGYAATLKVRGTAPPMTGGWYPKRTDWWDYVLTLPSPRIAVVQDADTPVGLGSFLGTVHINILQALGCAAAITNGAVRDLPEAEGIGFQLFSSTVAVSHAYVHIVDFGCPVQVAGTNIESGDLLHGDRHGFQTVPPDHAAEIPAAAARIKAQEEAIIALCRSADFSLEKLRAAVAG